MVNAIGFTRVYYTSGRDAGSLESKYASFDRNGLGSLCFRERSDAREWWRSIREELRALPQSQRDQSHAHRGCAETSDEFRDSDRARDRFDESARIDVE